MPSNTVKVDRSTKWGNPFIVGKHGNTTECVRLYRMMLNFCLNKGPGCLEQKRAFDFVRSNIDKLIGKDLACWCRSSSLCHADVLLDYAEQRANGKS